MNALKDCEPNILEKEGGIIVIDDSSSESVWYSSMDEYLEQIRKAGFKSLQTLLISNTQFRKRIE